LKVFSKDTGALRWDTEEEGLSIITNGQGYGHQRNSPDLRRMMGLSQLVLDAADPVNYAPHYFWDPLPGMKPKSAMINHTLGDMKVPISTGITMARAARILDFEHPLSVYNGETENSILRKHWVGEAIPRIDRFDREETGLGYYFDADDLGEGLDDNCDLGTYPGGRCEEHILNEPHIPDSYEEAGKDYETKFLRKTLTTPGLTHRNQGSGEFSGFRMPNIMVWDYAMQVEDRHGIFLPAPTKPFNLDQYMINLIGRYFQSRAGDLMGRYEKDNATCLEDKRDFRGNPLNECEFWEGITP